MKRFVNTERWDEGWWLRLSNDGKTVLRYLEDKCDCAGFVTLDPEMIAHRCHLEGEETVRGILKGELARKVVFGKNENIWLKDFIFEQESTKRLEWGNSRDRGIIKRLNRNILEFPACCDYIGENETVSDCQRPSETVRDCQRPSETVRDSSELLSSSNSILSYTLSLKNISSRLQEAKAGGFPELLKKVYGPTWDVLREVGVDRWIKRDSWVHLCRSFPMADPTVVAALVISDVQSAKDGKCPWLFKAAQKHFMNHEEVRLRLQAGKPVAGLSVGGAAPVETMGTAEALKVLQEQD